MKILIFLLSISAYTQIKIVSSGTNEISIGQIFYNSNESINESIFQNINDNILNTDILFKENFIVYPNSFKNYIIIQNKNSYQIDLKLYTILSSLIFELNTNKNKIIINTNNYSKGFYILKINHNNFINHFKLIKS